MDKVYKVSRVIERIGNGDITVDDSLSLTSTNPVQNKIITAALNSKLDDADIASKADLSYVNDQLALKANTTDLDNKADKSTTLAGYGITDAYTKTQVDGLVSSVYKYKGSKASLAEIQAIIDPSVGDVWNATDTDMNYAWTGTAWDPLGTTQTVILDDYYTQTQVNNLVNPKADKTYVDTQLGLKANASDLTSHINNKNNPHEVDKIDIGLGNVDNTSDVSKPISTLQQAALNEKQNNLIYAESLPQTATEGDIYLVPGSESGGGTTVVANNGEPTTANLSTLKVDNINYAIPQGGGTGTNVVANPTLVGTEELLKSIQINTTKFSIPNDVVDCDYHTFDTGLFTNHLDDNYENLYKGKLIRFYFGTTNVVTDSTSGNSISFTETAIGYVHSDDGAYFTGIYMLGSDTITGHSKLVYVGLKYDAQYAPYVFIKYVNEYTNDRKLNPEFIEQDTTHKFTTDVEKTSWNNKQNTLTAGNGISISDNTISSKVKYYSTLPATSELSAGDIVLVPAEQ